LTLRCAEVAAAAAESHQRLRGDERRAGNDIHIVPKQSGAAAVGELRLPVTQTSQQLGGRPRTSLCLHPQLDQTRTTQVVLALRLLLPAGY